MMMGTPTTRRGPALSLLAAVLTLLSIQSAQLCCAASAATTRGDLLLFNSSPLSASNTLSAYSPNGKLKASVSLGPTSKGPLDNDGFPSDGKRLNFQVYPGAVSPDGRFSFSPANVNKPSNKNTTDDLPYLIVTNLKSFKVVSSSALAHPGLSRKTPINFQADFFPPADNGDVEANLGYAARRYIAVGAPKGGKYPLYIVQSAFSCKSKSGGVPNKQQFFTKYEYDVARNKVSWAGARVLLTSSCENEGKGVLDGPDLEGRAVAASGSNGYLIASRTLGNPIPVALYKLEGNKLATVFKTGLKSVSSCNKFTLQRAYPPQLAAVCDAASSTRKLSVVLITASGGKAVRGISFGSREFVEATAAGPGSRRLTLSSFTDSSTGVNPGITFKQATFSARAGGVASFRQLFKTSSKAVQRGASSIAVVP